MALATALVVPLATALGAVATWAARAAARRLGVVGRPDPMVAQHTEPVSLLGGVGIAAAAAATLALDTSRPSIGAATAVGALLFLGSGLLDDIRELAPQQKLALQLTSASIAAALGATLGLTGNPVLDAVGGAVWIVVIVNAVNVTDVCDGLVAGLAVIALLVLAAAEPSLWEPCLVVGGACLGFLVFNAPPASIFLGDAGSSFLGFMLAVLSLAAVRRADSVSLDIQAVLLLGVPLFELAFVILVRWRKGEPWWRGSADHFSLRLQAAGLSRWQTDAVAWAAAAVLALAGLSFGHLAAAGRISLVVILLAALAAISRLLLHWEAPVTPGGRP